MKKNIFFFLSIIFLYILSSFSFSIFFNFNAAGAAGTQTANTDDDWVKMPAGSKPAYMGIHGGTMPVSLLVSGDGSSLLGFVGQTGNDFLEALKKVYWPIPSFSNATRDRLAHLLTSSRPSLFAGNSTATMPVIPLPAGMLASKTLLQELLPFGLSDEPLSIEGSISKPEIFNHPRKYRIFSLPDYFSPAK